MAVTAHALTRIEERFPDFVPEALASALEAAVEEEDYTVVGHAYGAKRVARVEFANVTVYALLGTGDDIVSVLAPGMVVGSPSGVIRLPARPGDAP